jgi:GAF domain-containing protein
MACEVAVANYAGITMLVEGKVLTAAFRHPHAPEIDEAQYTTGRGPCVSAYHDQKIYRIDSTADDDRWPEFAQTAAR